MRERRLIAKQTTDDCDSQNYGAAYAKRGPKRNAVDFGFARAGLHGCYDRQIPINEEVWSQAITSEHNEPWDDEQQESAQDCQGSEY